MLALLIHSLGPSGVAAQQTGALGGAARSATSAALPDVDLFLSGAGRRAVTDRGGRFVFPGVAAGTYELVAEHVGYATVRQEVTVRAGETTTVALVMEEQAIGMPEMVVVTDRAARSLSEVAASVGVIGASALREAAPAHPSEVMGQVPGVWVNVTGGEGHMAAIRQPLTTEPVYLYLEDGVPTRSTGFFNHNALYEVNVPQAERIEVMKGPASALYGSDAIGGVINVGTRAPTVEPSAELSLEAGAFGYGRALASASGALGENRVRAELNATRTDGWRSGTAYDRYSGTLRWDRSLGAGTDLQAVATYSRIDQQTAGSSAISREDFEQDPRINYTPISFREVSALRVSARIEHRAGPWTLDLTPFARHNTMDLLPNWSLSFDPAIWETGNASAGLLAKAHWAPVGSRTTVTTGLDVDYSPGHHVERGIVPEREGPVFTGYADGAPLYDYDVRFRSVSPYVQGTWTPTDRVHLSAGLRVDRMGYDYETHLAPTQEGQHRRPADASPTFGAVSPKVGVTVQALPAVNVFAAYRRGFRAPSEGQLFRQGSAMSTVDLDPVEVDSYEVGVRGVAGGVVRFEASLYHMAKTNDILAFRNPDGSTEHVNAGRTLHRGLEVGLGAQVASGVSVDGAYTVARHTYDAWTPQEGLDFGGNRMEFAPREIASARFTLAPPPLPTLRTVIEWSHVGPYWMDAANGHQYDGHHLLNVRATWQATGRVELFARLTNVTDARYAERATYSEFRGEELAPGLPRALHAGVRIR